MSKEIRHIDANVQGSKPQVVSASFDSHRPKNTRKDNTACFSGKQNLNQISQLELDPRRLIFDCLSNPAFYLLKLKNQPPEQRLKAYRTLFRSYWDNMEREAEINGAPTERWRFYLRGLEEARRAFRKDFPDNEFPIDED